MSCASSPGKDASSVLRSATRSGSRSVSIFRPRPRSVPCSTARKGGAKLVCPNGEGNVESLPNIHRRGLGPLEVAAAIGTDKLHPKYGLHALRHAAASLFISEGLSPKRVQSMMGHSTIQVTFDTYGHLFPSHAEDHMAMRRLQARLLC